MVVAKEGGDAIDRVEPSNACNSIEATMTQRRDILTAAAGAALALPGLSASNLPFAQDRSPIKVGVLHSLFETMAISETALKNTVLMAIEQINATGGVMGRPLEAVVVDPASNWPLFAEKARQLISHDRVAVTFGCWT